MVGFLGALGPILSGVAGIASAFGGGGGGQTTQKLNLGQLRRSAERHGFNPLTVLRNAPSGYMTTHHPTLSSGETLARAIGAGIDGLVATGVQQATMQRERELLDAQLDLIRAQTTRIRSAPRITGGAVGARQSSLSETAAALTGQRNAVGAPTAREVRPNETPITPPGYNMPGGQSTPTPQQQKAIEDLLPRTYVPIGSRDDGKQYGVTLPAGSSDLDSTEAAVGEAGGTLEGVRRTAVAVKQQPDWVIDTAEEIADAWWQVQKRATQRMFGVPDVGDPTGGTVRRPKPGQFDWTLGAEQVPY